jgi:hypothetical protein
MARPWVANRGDGLQTWRAAANIVNKESRNVQGSGGIRQTEILRAEPFVPEPSAAEVEVAIRKFKKYKAPGSNQMIRFQQN